MSTRPEVGADGEPTGRELPVLRPPHIKPPCQVCPKLEGVALKTPLAPADDPAADDGGWVWQAVAWVRECAAVNDFGRPDPLLRQLARVVRDHDARAERRLLSDAVQAGVRAALPRR